MSTSAQGIGISARDIVLHLRVLCQSTTTRGFLPKGFSKSMALGIFMTFGVFSKTSLPLVFSKATSSHPLLVSFKTTSYSGSFPKPLLQGSGLASPWTPSCPRASCMQDPFPKTSASWKRGCSTVNLLCFNLCFRLGLGKLLRSSLLMSLM